MKLSTAASLALICAPVLLPVKVSAFPNGAGSCGAGPTKFIPGSVHEDKSGGTLADGGLTVFLGTVDLNVGAETAETVGLQQFSPVGICTGEMNPETGFNLCENCQGEFTGYWPSATIEEWAGDGVSFGDAELKKTWRHSSVGFEGLSGVGSSADISVDLGVLSLSCTQNCLGRKI